MSPGVWLLSIAEVSEPLAPGSKLIKHGQEREVYEVKRLNSRSSPIAGECRDLFAALHAGPGSIIVFVCLDGEQTEWSAAAPSAPAWIACSERMPELMVDVLLFGNDGDRHIGYRNKGENQNCWTVWGYHESEIADLGG